METHVDFFLCLYHSLEDQHRVPPDEDFIYEDGDTIIMGRRSFLLVEQGNLRRSKDGIDSLRRRLFNEGSPIYMRRGSIRFHYGVGRRGIDQHLAMICRGILRFLLDIQNSHRQSIVFKTIFGCAVTLAAGRDGHYSVARILRESIEGARCVARPATEEAIDTLEKKLVDDGSNFGSRNCAICIEELSLDVEQICMPCKHVYHQDCIVGWLKTSHFCPLCRLPLEHAQ